MESFGFDHTDELCETDFLEFDRRIKTVDRLSLPGEGCEADIIVHLVDFALCDNQITPKIQSDSSEEDETSKISNQDYLPRRERKCRITYEPMISHDTKEASIPSILLNMIPQRPSAKSMDSNPRVHMRRMRSLRPSIG